MVTKKIDNGDDAEFQESSSVADTDRQIRVYDRTGDFIITVPAGCRMTFGYFNPATPSEGAAQRGYGSPDNVARQTALRIYRGKEDQLACFLGVKGFRDLSIGLTRFTRKVTVEQRMMDDGETAEWAGTRMRELVAAPEDEYQ